MARWKHNLRRRRTYRSYRLRYKELIRSRRMVTIAKFAFLGVIGLFLLLFLIFPFLAFNLPSPDKIVRREGFATQILDRNGKPLYDIFTDQKRTLVELDKVPLYLRQATISIEDKNFYEHEGFDPLGMIRGLSRIFTRGYAQGGSTLTQQLVKNVLLSSERTVIRKLKEFVLAVQIENNYTKDEILQMYLNEAPYGGTAWGVEAASQMYFGKSVEDLTLVESVIIAGLPQRPSVYSPYSSTPDAHVKRAQDVLRRMREDEYITKEQEEQTLDMLDDVEFQEKGANFKAPHFVQYVQNILEERYGELIVEQGGLKVTTTLDLELQEEAQKIVSEEINKVEHLDIGNGASVVVDPQTGEILAMVGSKDFSDPDYDGQVNVTMSLRQPGSAIKPVTYATAFKKGYTASTLLMDVATEFPGGAGQPPYKPVNYDGEYRGPVQVRYALGNSINIAAVKMIAMVGIKDTLQTAYDMGISSLEPSKENLSRLGLSMTLGGGEVRLLELTTAYSTFLNTGLKVESVAILKVEDNDGKTLEEIKPKKGKRVLSEGQAFLIADILSDNEARIEVFGPNSQLNISGRQVAVKTGTTNDKRDNWTVGGDPNVIVGVWVGNNDNSPMKQVASGITGASPIWRKIVLVAMKGKPVKSFEVPSEIVTASVDRVSGYRAGNGFPERNEYFIKGTEPEDDPVHVLLKVCKSDGNLATPSDIARNDYDNKEYFVFKEEDPFAPPGEENRWQKGILNWTAGIDDERYHPPSEYCGTENPVGIRFEEPGDRASNLDNKFRVKISADSTSRISEVVLYVNDERDRGFSSPPYETQLELEKGSYKLKAKAKDENGNESETTITVGVKQNWDYVPPTPTPKTTPTPTPKTSPNP